ncbi:MAG: HlyC/CorC family transporter [Clostridia bacterium]|nr:HlyC/CorC family transporter [Clostridia bacterium]
MDGSNTLQIVIMAILVLMSAYFSATETAFSSLNKTRLKTLAEDGNKRAALTLKLAENYDKLISTILIGNNIVNICLASLGTIFFIHIIHDENLGTTLSTVVITVVVLIFGEITPKSIAKDMPEKFAMFSTPFINLLIIILTPINFVFSMWKKLISKILKVEENEKMSQEELLMFVDEVEQEGTIDEDEGDLIRNVIEFTETQAEDILTHRVDLEAVPMDADKEEISKKFQDTQFSRLLVYEESIDNIIGFILQKDFYTVDGITKTSVKKLVKPVIFTQKTEMVNDLLKKLQVNKTHIAVVLDEYGGTLGIVTMEDILEELVGEIWDEHDEVVEDFQKLDEDKYRVDCSVNAEDFFEYFEIETETENVSLGGWVMEQLDKIPEKGDKFTFEELDITVIETDSRRATKIDVVWKKPLTTEE